MRVIVRECVCERLRVYEEEKQTNMLLLCTYYTIITIIMIIINLPAYYKFIDY